jgi:hypothetical protein
MENKDFTLHPEAFELKQLGFNEPCFKFYIETGELIPASYSKEGTVYPSNSDLLPEWTASPTYSQAFRWFREKYGLFGQVNIHTYFIYNISNGDFKMVNEYDKLFETYEEAELACLKKLIEVVKEGNK